MKHKEIIVNDRMQKGYHYVLTSPAGRDFDPLAPECPEGIVHKVKSTQTMLEPAVICSRINKACKSQLPYIPEALNPWVLNDIINKIARNAYETVYRIIYDLSFICQICHPLLT